MEKFEKILFSVLITFFQKIYVSEGCRFCSKVCAGGCDMLRSENTCLEWNMQEI